LGNFKAIIDTIPALAWSARPDGFADFFNQHYLDYVGLTQAQLKDHGWQVVVHRDDLPSAVTTWQRIMASETSGQAEARLRRFDGEYRSFLIRVNPLRDQAGRIMKWYGINTDIDDRKRAEDELRRKYIGAIQDVNERRLSEEALGEVRSELAYMTRVASLGALTASIAHEVNQPLSGIITNANTCLRMLASESPNLDGARETARRTIRDGNRAAEVIARLRAHFTKKDVAAELVDLNEATREVIALSASELQRARVILRAELTEPPPLVVGDRVQLQQVILNLLLNASAALHDVNDRPRHLSIRTECEEGERVRLTVRDAGIGLDAQTIERLFEAFHTTKANGMGLGLSVSRSIVESHRGRLWAEPNDGPGATFAFSLPRASRNS